VATADVSKRNAEFWEELCGSHLARELGITDASPGELARFDAAYLALYPYLLGYFPREHVEGRRVLEVGLGYGSLAEALARMGADYHGLDIAAGPVEMARHRLAGVPGAQPGQVRQGSVLELPLPDASFDLVASIGCLHHTGDLFGAVQEVRRVLRPGGRLVLMVYNRRSLRRLVAAPISAARPADADEAMRARYDATADGAAAPHTDFVTAPELRGLLHGLHDVRVERRNIEGVPARYLSGPSRSALMRLRVDRLLGLDLYATARRPDALAEKDRIPPTAQRVLPSR
jgi:SAM-dependent methyltransferase